MHPQDVLANVARRILRFETIVVVTIIIIFEITVLKTL